MPRRRSDVGPRVAYGPPWIRPGVPALPECGKIRGPWASPRRGVYDLFRFGRRAALARAGRETPAAGLADGSGFRLASARENIRETTRRTVPGK
jgi:hypothetical protein